MSDQETNPLSLQPVCNPVPFASDNRAIISTIPDSQPIGTAPTPNLSDGFPSSFSAPASSSGKYVTRGHMNGIGNLMTTNEVRKKLGGINTFNPSLVAKVGGYAKDAILDWWDERNQIVCKVISLWGDSTNGFNDIDFTRRGEDGYSIGPDGINWAYCSANGMWLPDYAHGIDIMAKSQISLPTKMEFVTGVYTMPFDGFLSVKTAETYTIPCSIFTAIDASTCFHSFKSGAMIPGFYSFTFSVTGDPIRYFGLVTGDVYDKCRHSMFLALSSDGTFKVDMSNVIDGTTDNTIILVSSSGTTGSGGCSLIPVRRGVKFRLLGEQTYTLAQSDETITPEGTAPTGFKDQVKTLNNLASTGAISMTARVVAYPAIGMSEVD